MFTTGYESLTMKNQTLHSSTTPPMLNCSCLFNYLKPSILISQMPCNDCKDLNANHFLILRSNVCLKQSFKTPLLFYYCPDFKFREYFYLIYRVNMRSIDYLSVIIWPTKRLRQKFEYLKFDRNPIYSFYSFFKVISLTIGNIYTYLKNVNLYISEKMIIF